MFPARTIDINPDIEDFTNIIPRAKGVNQSILKSIPLPGEGILLLHAADLRGHKPVDLGEIHQHLY